MKMVISYVIILKDLSLSFNQRECEIMKSTKSLERYALLFLCKAQTESNLPDTETVPEANPFLTRPLGSDYM